MSARDRAIANADGVVFLCSGNMVRSAFADLYAKHIGFPLPVLSGATTYRNDGIFPETARALLTRGVSAATIRAFVPTHLDELMPRLEQSELETPIFFAMRHHHRAAMRTWPDHFERTFLMDSEREIADPVLEGADFDQTFAAVERCVDALERALVGNG